MRTQHLSLSRREIGLCVAELEGLVSKSRTGCAERSQSAEAVREVSACYGVSGRVVLQSLMRLGIIAQDRDGMRLRAKARMYYRPQPQCRKSSESIPVQVAVAKSQVTVQETTPNQGERFKDYLAAAARYKALEWEVRLAECAQVQLPRLQVLVQDLERGLKNQSDSKPLSAMELSLFIAKYDGLIPEDELSAIQEAVLSDRRMTPQQLERATTTRLLGSLRKVRGRWREQRQSLPRLYTEREKLTAQLAQLAAMLDLSNL